MQLKCDNCGYVGSQAEFRFLSHVDSAGSDCYRQCPKCHVAVYSEEVGESEDYSGKGVWGAGPLRGKVFRRRSSEDGKSDEDRSGEEHKINK